MVKKVFYNSTPFLIHGKSYELPEPCQRKDIWRRIHLFGCRSQLAPSQKPSHFIQKVQSPSPAIHWIHSFLKFIFLWGNTNHILQFLDLRTYIIFCNYEGKEAAAKAMVLNLSPKPTIPKKYILVMVKKWITRKKWQNMIDQDLNEPSSYCIRDGAWEA